MDLCLIKTTLFSHFRIRNEHNTELNRDLGINILQLPSKPIIIRYSVANTRH